MVFMVLSAFHGVGMARSCKCVPRTNRVASSSLVTRSLLVCQQLSEFSGPFWPKVITKVTQFAAFSPFI